MLKSIFAFMPAAALAIFLTAAGGLPSATDAFAAYDRPSGLYYYDGYTYYPVRRPYTDRRPRYHYYGYSCERMRRVMTDYGWRWRPVNSCYPYYRSYYDYE
jgi:hypothetical protein